MANRYLFKAVKFTNHAPFSVSPKTQVRVPYDNPFINNIIADPKELKNLDTTAFWLQRPTHAVPAIPATGFKGVLRNLATDYVTSGESNLPIQTMSRLLIGGVKEKKKEGETAEGTFPAAVSDRRLVDPLISVFGGCDPEFVSGFATFSHAIPEHEFTMHVGNTVRRDPLYSSNDMVGQIMSRVSATDKSEALGQTEEMRAAIKAVKKKITDEKFPKLYTDYSPQQKARSEELKKELAAVSEVSTASLHNYIAIPAGVSFSHSFSVIAEEHEIGLLLIALARFAKTGGSLGARAAAGCGAQIEFQYQVLRLDDDGLFGDYTEVGQIHGNGAEHSCRLLPNPNGTDELASYVGKFEAILPQYREYLRQQGAPKAAAAKAKKAEPTVVDPVSEASTDGDVVVTKSSRRKTAKA